MKNIFLIHDILRKDRNYHEEITSQGISDVTQLMLANKDTSSAITNISRAHKSCIRHAKAFNMERIIIMEDDIHFLCNKSFQRFLELEKLLPDNWDLFFSGAYDAEIKASIGSIATVEKISGLHCYMVHSRFYDTLLSAPENINLDKWMTTLSTCKSNSFLAYPMLAIQHDGWSDNVKRETNYNISLRAKYKLWDCSQPTNI